MWVAGVVSRQEKSPVNINSFLIARVDDNEAAFAADHQGVDGGAARRTSRSQIELHHNRSMHVTSLAGSETWTRCGVCAGQPDYPCNAVKLMASTYESHVDFDPAWHLATPTSA